MNQQTEPNQDHPKLDEQLDSAVWAVLSAPIPGDAVKRVKRRALDAAKSEIQGSRYPHVESSIGHDQLSTELKTSDPTHVVDPFKRPFLFMQSRNHWLQALSGVAAIFAVAVLITMAMTSSNDAWAQVVNAVENHKWMRLTLVEPEGGRPEESLAEGEEFPDVRMWFRGDGKIAALSMPDGARWVDVERGNSHRFDPDSSKVFIGKLDRHEDEEIRSFLLPLQQFRSEKHLYKGQHIKLVNVRESEVTVDNMTYLNFEFSFDDPRTTPQRSSMSVRVNKATMLPVQLTIHHGEKSPVNTFGIDYPDTGPSDIYALDVPQETQVVDVRSLDKYFQERPAIVPGDYTAIAISAPAESERKWIIDASRYEVTNGVAKASTADIEQLNELANRVYFGEGGSPTGDKPELAWWVDEVSKLTFKNRDIAESNFPHGRCYMAYGGADLYRSVHDSTLPELTGTVELRGPKHSVWLDPARDMIVKRFETVGDDGRITVYQNDRVIQDKRGVWLATRWRVGEVAQRGDSLLSVVDRTKHEGVARTMVQTADIKFD